MTYYQKSLSVRDASIRIIWYEEGLRITVLELVVQSVLSLISSVIKRVDGAAPPPNLRKM